jgi:hypothetical protein
MSDPGEGSMFNIPQKPVTSREELFVRLLEVATRSRCCHRDPHTEEKCVGTGHCADLAMVESVWRMISTPCESGYEACGAFDSRERAERFGRLQNPHGE